MHIKDIEFSALRVNLFAKILHFFSLKKNAKMLVFSQNLFREKMRKDRGGGFKNFAKKTEEKLFIMI